MKLRIKTLGGSVLFESEAQSLRELILGAVKAKANLCRADLSGAYLSGAYLSGANLCRADLSGAYLSGANLSGAYLSGAYLRGADLSGANLCRADLSGAYLRGADLSRADLSGADLSRADLSGAYLRGADLSRADLSGADLSWANLGGANLSGANLSGANLCWANLRGANLGGANLSGANGLKNLDALEWFRKSFKKTKRGVIVYKCFGGTYSANPAWKIEPGAVISENCNPNPTDDCGCGVNFATLEWVKREHPGKTIWRCLIPFAWLPGVVVPWNTDGKARCSKLILLREEK
jgi:uncharacterized protein YjbI with pentapeptide repeats